MAPETLLKPVYDSDRDVEAARRGYDVWLEERLGARGLALPIKPDQNQPVVPGVLILLHPEAFIPRERKKYLQHNEVYHEKSNHIWIVTDNHGDPTGKSGILAYPVRIEDEAIYMASHTMLPLTVKYAIKQPDTKTQPHEYISGFVDIVALERMKFDTSGIARFIDPDRGIMPLSEFVAQQL